MRAALTKKPESYDKLSYAVLASGMTSGVWNDEEASDKAHTSLGKEEAIRAIVRLKTTN